MVRWKRDQGLPAKCNENGDRVMEQPGRAMGGGDDDQKLRRWAPPGDERSSVNRGVLKSRPSRESPGSMVAPPFDGRSSVSRGVLKSRPSKENPGSMASPPGDEISSGSRGVLKLRPSRGNSGSVAAHPGDGCSLRNQGTSSDAPGQVSASAASFYNYTRWGSNSRSPQATYRLGCHNHWKWEQ